MSDEKINGYIRGKWVLRGNRPVIENMTIALQKDDGFPKIISNEEIKKSCQKYWSDPNLETPTWEDGHTPYYEEEPFVQNFDED